MPPSPICGATRQDGQPCRMKPCAGSTRCKHHGGLAPSGIGHPNYRHGMYSKALPAGLRSTFEAALQDPELLSAVEEVGLLKVRIARLLERLESGGGKDAWQMARIVFHEMEVAIGAKDVPAFQNKLASLGQILHQGADAEAAWHDLYDAIDRKTRVSAAEWKRQVDLQQVITADQAFGLINAIMQAVARHVPDISIRQLISHDIRAITNRPLPARVVDLSSPPAPVDITPDTSADSPDAPYQAHEGGDAEEYADQAGDVQSDLDAGLGI